MQLYIVLPFLTCRHVFIHTAVAKRKDIFGFPDLINNADIDDGIAGTMVVLYTHMNMSQYESYEKY